MMMPTRDYRIRFSLLGSGHAAVGQADAMRRRQHEVCRFDEAAR